MDEEFGIGDLVEEEFGPSKVKAKVRCLPILYMILR